MLGVPIFKKVEVTIEDDRGNGGEEITKEIIQIPPPKLKDNGFWF